MTLSRLRAIWTESPTPTTCGFKLCLALTVVAALGVAETARAGSGFTWFTNATDISPGTTGSWQDINLTAQVPAGATGVVVQFVNSGNSDYRGMVRGKEDTRDYMTGASNGALRNKTHRFQVVKLDANRMIQGYISDSNVLLKLMGYTTGSDPAYFTTPPDVTPGAGSWTEIDVSGSVDADADGAILLVYNSAGSDYTYSIRETSSGYANTSLGLRDYQNTMFMVGLDANKKFDAWIQNTSVKIYLVGQTKGSVVYYPDDTVVADPPSFNSWKIMDADDYAVPEPANGLVLLTELTDRTRAAVRHGDSSDDWGNTEYVDHSTLIQQAIGINAANQWSELFKDATPAAYIAAYTTYSSLTVNYRSIGTDTGTLYSTGNASVTAGSTTVTFAGGASLPANVGQGDELVVGGETLYILSRDSATQVTVQQSAAAAHTNAAYTIKRVYNTLQAWETARQGDLVAEDRREVGVCYDDGDFNGPLDIEGSTTDSTHYLKLTVADGQRHSGVAGGGVVVDAGGGPGGPLLWVRDPYTQVEWIELTNFDRRGILVSGSAPNVVFQNLLIHGGSGSYSLIETGYDAVIRNCILYDGWKGILNTGASHATLENVTIYNMSQNGVDMHATADITVRNTIAVGCGTADFDLPGTINYFGNNMFSTTTGGFDPDAQDGGNQAPPTSLDDLFISITSGSEDLHLEALGNLAVDNGLDLSGSFTDDVDGETRSAPWDIGADWEATDVNYRSIGTDSGTLYSTGNASITADERIVTFASATLPTNIGQGDELVLNASETLYIYSRDSDTQVTVQGVAAATHANVGYTIKRVYNTMQAWEDARDGDLVTDDRIEVGVCYNDGEFTAGATVAGSTTDAGHYLKLTVAEGQRHDATAQSGARINGASYVGGDYIFSLADDYSVLEWLEIYNFNPAPSCGTGAVKTWDGREATIEYLLIHNFNSCAAAIELYHGGTIRNCLIYNGDTGIFLNMSNEGQTGIVENCTIWTWWCGVRAWPGAYPVEIRNTIAVDASADFDLENDTIAYFGSNMYDPATVLNFDPDLYQGGNQTPPADLDDLFVSSAPGSKDLHLEVEGHMALGTGLDLSSSFTKDIDGQVRVAPWDIGADWVEIDINYRSIGIDSGTLYSLGDATIPVGSTTVTFGFGADLPTNIGLGDELVIGIERFYILSRDSATQVTVQAPATSAHTGEAYTIKRVYNTLQKWEDDVSGDLVGDARREVGVCYNDGRFTEQLLISGSTTSAAYYLRLTVAEGQRHNGILDAGAGIDGTAWGNADAITVEDEYTRIEWLEFEAHTNAGDAVWFKNSPAADNGLVHGIFVHGYWQNSNAGVRAVAPNITIRNSFFTGGTSAAISVDTGCTMCYIENCTIIGSPSSGSGVSAGASTDVSIKNTISVNHASGDDFVLWASISYFGNNMFGSVTGFDPDAQDGGNQLPPSNLERLFVDISNPGAPDLHLEPRGHRAGNTGLDLSASFTDDIDGVTRVDSWDIGADEAIDGTDPLPPVVITWKEVDPNE